MAPDEHDIDLEFAPARKSAVHALSSLGLHELPHPLLHLQLEPVSLEKTPPGLERVLRPADGRDLWDRKDSEPVLCCSKCLAQSLVGLLQSLRRRP